jgi:hypothetical protein
MPVVNYARGLSGIPTVQYAHPELGEGNVTSPDAWSRYVAAMREHLAYNERLCDRLRFFVGDALQRPVALTPSDLIAWRGLLCDAESTAKRHREAFDSLRDATRLTTP